MAGLTLMAGSRAAAEDAVQEAVARAWERSQRGDAIESLPAWVTRVAVHDIQPTVSPDGRTVVFVRYDPATLRTSLWSVGIDGTDAHQVSPARAFSPAYAPDGTTVATTGAGRPEDGGILLMSPDGTAVSTVPNTDSSMQYATWSPDGSRLAVQTHGDRYAVSLIGVDGSGRTDLPETSSSVETQPACSPDGRSIAFVRDRDVWLYDLAGETARRLTTFPGSDGGDTAPTWSPDGRSIAFERYFSPSERFVYVMAPDGSGRRRVGLGGTPAWGVAQPDSSPTEPSPSETASPEHSEPGRDIGLAFNLCRLQPLHGVDFLGTGTAGTAWVGGRLAGDGSCPSEYEGESVVAVDVDGDGDGVAESWAALSHCVGCSPLSLTDLNGDGIQELVVTMQFSATTEYTVFSLQPAPGAGPPVLEQVRVAEPGAPPFLRPGRPLTFWSGGDAGFTAWVRCEGYPQDPVLVITETERPIEGPGSDVRQVDTARLVLRPDGTVEVIGSESYTEPATYASNASTGRACGLDLWPAA